MHDQSETQSFIMNTEGHTESAPLTEASPKISDGEKQSVLKRYVDAADIFSKICVGIAALIGTTSVYLAYQKYVSDVDHQCSATRQYILEKVPTKQWQGQGDLINDYVHSILPDECNTGPFVNVLVALTAPQQIVATCPSSTPAEQSPLQGWVAVGFPNSFNFVSKNCSNLKSSPNKGDVLRAKWKVNVRPDAADWRNVRGTLDTGQCFKIDETRDLRAGAETQTWALGSTISCPQT